MVKASVDPIMSMVRLTRKEMDCRRKQYILNGSLYSAVYKGFIVALEGFFLLLLELLRGSLPCH